MFSEYGHEHKATAVGCHYNYMRVLPFFILSLISFSCVEKDRDRGDTDVTSDIGQLRREYILTYDKPIEFESVHRGKDFEDLKAYGKYYCLFDSAILVPGKYNLDDTTKSFKTHNFAEEVIIISNGDTILQRTITKRDFHDKLPEYLKNYAVLFEPKFEGYSSSTDVFDFSFSISIPLTDVGLPMLLSLKRNGQINVDRAQ